MRIRKRTEEQQARRALISELLSAANVQSMDDIRELFKETIAEFVEGSLNSKPDDKLGYDRMMSSTSPQTTAEMVTARKRCVQVWAESISMYHVTEMAILSLRILPKNQMSISQDMENKIIPMYSEGMSTSDIEE